MVAVVSGNSLGLFNSSRNILGGGGAVGNPTTGRGGEQVFVNSATGNLIIQDRDETLSGLGVHTPLVRTYNSQGLLDDDNGDNWRLGVHQRLVGPTGTVNTAGSTITKVFGDGAAIVYTYNSAQSKYVSSDGDGADDTLSYDSGTSIWTWTDGTTRNTETYDTSLRLATSSDADGNTTTYGYTGALLTLITDASGQKTHFDYTVNPATGISNLTDIRVESDGVTQTLTHYTYDSLDRLSTVRVDLSPGDNSIDDDNVFTTTYTYEATSKRVASITHSDSTSVSFTYELVSGVYRVKTYTISPDGSTAQTTTFTYTTGGAGTATVNANNAVLTTSETVTTQVPVTPYYAVRTGDTWESIAQRVYGDATLASLLKAALGNPALVNPQQIGGLPQVLVDNVSGQVYVIGSGAASTSPVTNTYLDNAGRVIGTQHADGSFVGYTYDASGNLLERRKYAQPPVPATYSQDFSQDASGLTPLPTGFTQLENGGLTFINRGDVEWEWGFVEGTRVNDRSSQVVYRAEITTDDDVWGRQFSFGVHSADGPYYFVGAFYGPYLYTSYNDADGGPYDQHWGDMEVQPDTTYVVELVMGSAGNDSQLYVYEKGKSRDSGIQTTHAFDWTGTRMTMMALGATGLTGVTTRVDNISEASVLGAPIGPFIAPESAQDVVDTYFGTTQQVHADLGLEGGHSRVYQVTVPPGATQLRVTTSGTSITADGEADILLKYGAAPDLNNWDYRSNGPENNENITVDEPQAGTWYVLLNASTSFSDVDLVIEYDAPTLGTQSYTVANGDTWASIAQALYGSATLGDDLQAALGNIALAQPQHLTVPATLSRTLPTTRGYLINQGAYGSGTPAQSYFDDAGHLIGVLNTDGSFISYQYDDSGVLTGYRYHASTPPQALWSQDFSTSADGLEPLYDGVDVLENGGLTVRTLGDAEYGWSKTFGTRTYDFDQHVVFRSEVTTRADSYRLLLIGAENVATTRRHAAYFGGGILYANYKDPELGGVDVELGNVLDNTTYVVEVVTDATGSTLYVYQKGSSRADGFQHHVAITDWDDARTYFETFGSTGYPETSMRIDNISEATIAGTLIGPYIVPEDPSDVVSSNISHQSVSHTGLALETGDALNYTVTVPPHATQMRVRLTGSGSGDADVWVRYNDIATRNDFDYKSNGATENEYIVIPAPAAGTWHFRVDAAESFSDVDLQIEYDYAPDAGQSYTVVGGDTWISIAQALYGTTSVADELQAALGSPTLTTGLVLHDLPQILFDGDATTTTNYSRNASEIVSTETQEVTQPVTPYYTVRADDTWAIIADRVYGMSDAEVVAALQAALGSPTLTTGAHLVVPQTLTYGTEGLSTQTDIQSPLGFVTTLVNDSDGRLIAVQTPSGGSTPIETQYAYDAQGNVTRITEDPNGRNRQTVFQYDERGNLLLSCDADGNTVTRTYSATNQLLTETRYLVADSDGVEGPQQPGAPLTTRYAYDAADRLRFVVSADGRVAENRYNGVGLRTATLQYADAVYDVTGLAATATLSESQLVTWVAARDLQKLQRVDYEYDFRGNLSARKAYGATDSSGAGITATASVTRFTYDQRGQLILALDARSEATPGDDTDYATTYTYDGLGRLLTTSVWVDSTHTSTTVNQYDDAQNRAVTTLANGLVTTSLYDRAGHLVSIANTGPSNTSLGTTTYTYDADGRLRISTDPTGVRLYVLYDEAGRKVADVDGARTLTRYVYDNANQIVKTVRYADALTPAQVATLTDAQGKPTAVTVATLLAGLPTTVGRASDQIVRDSYDDAGRRVYHIDAAGGVTQYFYDGEGRLTDQLQYATPITIASSIDEVLPDAITVTATTDDRHTRMFYDRDGDLLGTLDAAGYLVEHVYDAAGQLTKQVGYAIQTDPAHRASGTLDQLRPAGSADDIASYFFYDGQGRKVGVLDAEGYLTETQFDAAGNVSQSARYDRVLTFSLGTSSFDALKTAATGAPIHVSSYQYDGAGRLTQETNYEGTVTTYAYDSVGNLTSTTRAQSTSDARKTEKRYDALGRIVQELTAEGSGQITSTMTQSQIDAIWAGYAVTYAYDTAGRRISSTDQNGNTTLYFYDAAGRLRYGVNALGEVSESTYNALGQQTSTIRYAARISTSGLVGGTDLSVVGASVAAIADAAKDARTNATYTLKGQLASSSSAAGAQITHGYDAFGDETSRSEAIDATHNLAHQYSYDARGLLTETRWDPSGLNTTEESSYDAFGRLISQTDSNGNAREVQYDRLGRVVLTTDPLSATNATTYDAFSRTLTTTDALGNITQYAYDDVARSVVVTTPEGISFTTVLNRIGQTASVTDGRGSTTTYQYDANGQLLSTSDELGPLSERAYDRAGRMITSTDANGILTAITYDAANRVFTRTVDTATDGLALTTSYTYDAQGRVTDTTDARGVVTHTEYDRDGRVTAVVVDYGTAPHLNLRTEYQYDRRGSVVQVTEGAESNNPRVTQYLYDTLGRRTSEIVDPGDEDEHLNLTTSYEYDASGNVVRKTDANGFGTRYVYDANDRLRYTIDALSGVTETVYDSLGRVTATRRYATAINTSTLPATGALSVDDVSALLSTDARDRVKQSVYDKDGRETFTIDALGGVTQKDYDANGNVIRQRMYVNPIAAGSYATRADVIAALIASGNTPATLAPADRMQWTMYDARNRVVFDVDGLGDVTHREYDDNGNVTAVTAFATRIATDATTLSTIDSWAAAHQSDTTNHTTRAWYDGNNRAVFSLDAEGYLRETSYDDVGRKTTETVYADKPTIPAGATFSDLRDRANGVSIPQSSAADQVTVTDYDAASRVVKVTDALGHFETYTYDAVGNRLSFTNKNGATWTYDYDANRRLTFEHSPQVTITTVHRDSIFYGGMYGDGFGFEGFLFSDSDEVSLTTAFEYDSLGNVVNKIEANGRSDARETGYEYDALGRQIRTRLPTTTVYSSFDEGGDGGHLGRYENAVQPYTEVTYDTLGNAVVNRDVAGNYSFKAYDKLGRLQYDVDAEGYVTEHRYDTFGNQTDLIRYANRIDVELSDPEPLTAQLIHDEGLVVDATADRTIHSDYDRLNRVVQVVQPAALNFEPSAGAAGGQTFTAGATTINEYDAFGQVVKQSRLVNPLTNLWADSYSYYDRRGEKTADVDALGFLTTYEYDAAGNQTRQVEFAKALSIGTWSVAGYASATATTPTTSPNDPAGYDREAVFGYDRLNRKISETRVGIVYNQVSGQTVTTATGDQTTTFGYDAVGNQTRVTDANGAATYTYYDVLGRQIATAAPTRDRGDGVELTPLAVMNRDAFGNLVEQIIYANGAASANETSFTAAATSSSDRITRMQVDAYGHVMHSVDATGVHRYASYDISGNVAKEWEPADDTSRPSQISYYDYDRLGRRTSVRELFRIPEGPELLDRLVQYNAFGEVIAQGTDVESEFFDYDQAGRLWRTNSGDGVTKVYLYNLAGQATAEIKSQTLDLTSYASAADVAALTSGLMRTETRYDFNGRQVEQRLPAFVQANPNSELQNIGSQLRLDDNVLGPSNPDAVYRLIGQGYDYGDGAQYYYTVPSLDPGATPAQGGGYYFTAPTASNPAGGWARDPTYHLVASRFIHWTQPEGFVISGGSWSVTPHFEYRAAGNPNGAWTEARVVALPNGELGVDIGALASGDYEYRLTYSRANELQPYAEATGTVSIGSGAPTLTDTTAATLAAANVIPTATVVEVATNTQFRDAQFRIGDLNGIGIDPYVYRRVVTGALVDYVPDRWAAVEDGGGYYLTSNGYVQKTDYDPGTSRYVYWNAPTDSTLTATFEYRPIDLSSDWSEVEVTSLANNRLGVAIGDIDAGQFEFRVTYSGAATGETVAEASGTFRIDPTVTANHLAITPNPPDDLGHIAPLANRPPGSSDITSQIVSSSSPDHVNSTYGELYFTGANDVLLKFPSVSGQVRVEIEYTTQPYSPPDQSPQWPSVSRTISVLVADASSASSGIHVNWKDPAGIASTGGIAAVTNVRVYSVTTDGSATLQYSTDAGSTGAIHSTSLSWTAPWESDIVATFDVRAAGTTTWQPMTITRVGGDFTVDTATLGNGHWEYQVTYTQNGVTRAGATGAFVVSGGSLTNVAETPSSGIEPVGPIAAMGTAPVEFSVVHSAQQTTSGTTYDTASGGETHNNHPLTTGWGSTGNQVDVTWASLGSGPVRVQLDYTSADRYVFNYDNVSNSPHWEQTGEYVPGQAATQTFDFVSGDTGASLTWTDPSASLIGGVQSINRIRVYTQDAQGNWVLRYDRDTAAPVGGKSVYWPSPDDSAITTQFQIRAHATTTWQTLSVSTDTHGHQFVPLNSFVDGDYDYQITYLNGTTVTAVASGTIAIQDSATAATSGHALAVTQSTVTFDQGANDFGPVLADGRALSWSHAPAANDSIVILYRQPGQSTWQSQAVSGSGPDFTATLPGTGHDALEFQIQYIHSGETLPYAQAAGTLDKALAVTRSAPTISLTQTATTTSDLAPVENVSALGAVISWTTLAEPNATVQFRYQLGDGTWQNLDVVSLDEDGFGVDPRVLLPGTYRYEIRYVRASETEPYAFASGTITTGRLNSGAAQSIVDTTSYVKTTIQQTASGIATVVETFDRWGNVLTATDAANNTTTYRYNQLGELVQTKQPEVQVVSTAGGVVTTTTAQPETDNYYDVLGRLIATQDADAHVTSVTYNAAGQVIAENHADGGVKSSIYDVFGNEVESIDELGYRSRNAFDRDNRLIVVDREVALGAFASNDTDHIVENTYTYDKLGHKIAETDGAGAETQYEYWTADYVTTRINARGMYTYYEYDHLGHKTSEHDANGNGQSWFYDDFGKLLSHTDMGGVVFQYAYDYAGQLIRQTSSAGQNLTYEYDGAGHLTRIIDHGSPTGPIVVGAGAPALVASNRLTEYGYDIAGRRITERTTIDGRTQQNTIIHYDALGRVSELQDVNYDTKYSYDAAGNRTRINSSYYNHTGYSLSDLQTQDLWYTYDAMNRVLVSQGVNTSGNIGIDTSQGVELTYDLAGQRTSARTSAEHIEITQTTDAVGNVVSTTYQLANGLYTEHYGYDGLGRLTTTTEDAAVSTYNPFTDQTTPSTQALQLTVRSYDKASRETGEESWSLEQASASTLTERNQTTTYDADGLVQSQSNSKNGQLESVVHYGYLVLVPGHYEKVTRSPPTFSTGNVPYDPNSSAFEVWVPEHWEGTGYDPAGVLRGYAVDTYQDGQLKLTTTYSITYRLGDTYLQTEEKAHSEAKASDVLAPTDGKTVRTYDVNDYLVQITDTKDASKNRYFANNALGQTLAVVQGNFDGQNGHLSVSQAFDNALVRTGNQVKGQYFFFANGQMVGSFGQLQSTDGTFKANFDVNYTAISDGYPLSVPSQVIVQSGDTLRSIAARVFGDPNLWYVIADENGLTDPDAVLEEGTQLRIPNDVISLSNQSTSFKPFDVSDAIGDTTPTQPAPPPPRRKHGCGVLGQLLVAVVAIVVTVYTAGVLTAANWGAVAAAAGGGAAGSIASQGVAIATHQQEGFSWSGVALGAISGAVTAGLGDFGEAGFGRAVGEGIHLSGSVLDYGATAINAAAASTLTQGIGVLTSLQKQFSWKEVAISTVSAPIADYAAMKVSGAPAGLHGTFGGNFTAGVSSALVRRAFGGKIDAASVLVDAFGNALGNSIVHQSGAPAPSLADSSDSSAPIDDLEEVQISVSRLPPLDNNPTNAIRAGGEISPDQARERGSQERRGVVTIEEIPEADAPADGSVDPAIVGYNINREPVYSNGVTRGGQMRRISDASGLYYNEAQVFDGVLLSPYQDENGVKAWGYERDGEMHYIRMTPPSEGEVASADAGLMASGGALALARNSGAMRVAYGALTAAERRNVAVLAAATTGTAIGIWLRQQTRNDYVTDGPAVPWSTHTPNNGPIVSPPLITPNNGPTRPTILTTPDLGPVRPTILTTPNNGQAGPTLLGTPIDSGVDPAWLMLNQSVGPLSESAFNDLIFDADKSRITPGAVEEVRVVQAAQREGLAPQGDIVRGERGVDLAIQDASGGTTPYSIKAYKDASVLAEPRKYLKLLGSLKADTSVNLLLDTRSLSAADLSNISGRLVSDGISPQRIVVPNTKSFAPIEVVLPDGRIVHR